MNRFQLNRKSPAQEIALFPPKFRIHRKARKWRPQEGELYYARGGLRGIERKIFTAKEKWCLDDLATGNFYLTTFTIDALRAVPTILFISFLVSIQFWTHNMRAAAGYVIIPVVENIWWILLGGASVLVCIGLYNNFGPKRKEEPSLYTVYYNFEYGAINAYLMLGEKRLNLFSSPDCFRYLSNCGNASIKRQATKKLNYYLKLENLKKAYPRHVSMVEESPRFYVTADHSI